MSAQRLTVERDGYGWSVCKGGLRVRGAYSNKGLAEAACDRMEREARCKRRPCITCGETFMSEGPGNRMCDKCRANSTAIFDGRRRQGCQLFGGGGNAGKGDHAHRENRGL